MAIILGEVGQYPISQARINHRKFVAAGLAAFAVLGAILGITMGQQLPFNKLPPGLLVVCGFVLAVTAIGTGIYSIKKMDTFERARLSMRRGADGETRVGQILHNFPESFSVINGLVTSVGDLDHIVVGPTGVFVVDAKNWRGVVSSDGNGELLLNGKPTEKATIKALIARTMDVKEKIQTLCGFEPPFFQVILAFTSAWVDARWGTTGKALCVTDDGLHDLILENRSGVRLSGQQVEAIARAFEALARMDKDFKR